MSVVHDYHVHSNYSDGTPMPRMLAAAEDAGLRAVGFADHCNVSERDHLRTSKREYGINLDRTYPFRREGIESLRDRYDLRVFDAVEMDYDPRDESEIAAFLDEADFDYAVGSVHRVEGTNVQRSSPFADLSERERQAFVDDYYERLSDLVESELFAIVAHVDLPERTPELRGYTTPDHHAMLADALASSRTVPELNAGRVRRDYGQFHPAPDLWAALRERGVEFVAGSDSHDPDEIPARKRELDEYFAEREADPVVLFE
ncbi:PHP domain-containing protein [Halorussus gelatinilyticus]|uniref:histidinol-phosphatase n=1 Tax=Halorussus gelatinilyticus TaxID=2937524 RepID=A0A8U0IIY3_9EURY|nr:PHP domain-containing protein [Halorussus gelatinilyticus]UPW00621.1 PHP domain-containing protein [Halorussus gelatinilyticus]